MSDKCESTKPESLFDTMYFINEQLKNIDSNLTKIEGSLFNIVCATKEDSISDTPVCFEDLLLNVASTVNDINRRIQIVSAKII